MAPRLYDDSKGLDEQPLLDGYVDDTPSYDGCRPQRRSKLQWFGQIFYLALLAAAVLLVVWFHVPSSNLEWLGSKQPHQEIVGIDGLQDFLY
jgi:hypothetical protein